MDYSCQFMRTLILFDPVKSSAATFVDAAMFGQSVVERFVGANRTRCTLI